MIGLIIYTTGEVELIKYSDNIFNFYNSHLYVNNLCFNYYEHIDTYNYTANYRINILNNTTNIVNNICGDVYICSKWMRIEGLFLLAQKIQIKLCSQSLIKIINCHVFYIVYITCCLLWFLCFLFLVNVVLSLVLLILVYIVNLPLFHLLF